MNLLYLVIIGLAVITKSSIGCISSKDKGNRQQISSSPNGIFTIDNFTKKLDHDFSTEKFSIFLLAPKILVATGYPYENGQNTEIIDLANPNFKCVLLTDSPPRHSEQKCFKKGANFRPFKLDIKSGIEFYLPLDGPALQQCHNTEILTLVSLVL